jgi:hypothetical protein
LGGGFLRRELPKTPSPLLCVHCRQAEQSTGAGYLLRQAAILTTTQSQQMESVINEIEFDFDQTVSIRTDVKLSKDDVKQIVSESPEETLEEIVYQSLVTDELYLRARAKEIVAKLKQEDLDVNRIEYWDDEGNKV